MSQIKRSDSSSGVYFSTDKGREVLNDGIGDPTFLDRIRRVTSDGARKDDEPLRALLQIGVDWLEVEQGHLAQIDVAGGTHTIAEVSGPHPGVALGDTRDLSRTYCRRVLAENAVLAVGNAPEEGWEDDAAYEEFGYSTYLGAKVVVDGTLYGTLCFVGREAREDPFTGADAAAVERLSRSIGQLLENRNQRRSFQPTSVQLKALFDRSPNMITIHDEVGNLVAPNPHLCEKTGYTEEELTGMKVWELDRDVTPEDARAFWAEMDPNDRARWEGTYRRADGTTFPVEVDLRCVEVDGRRRFIATGRDITGRKEAERELRDTKRLLEKTFESLSEAVVVVDPSERKIITCNAAVEDIFGYEREELIGESTKKLHKSPEAYERFAAISEPLLEEDGIFRDESSHRTLLSANR